MDNGLLIVHAKNFTQVLSPFSNAATLILVGIYVLMSVFIATASSPEHVNVSTCMGFKIFHFGRKVDSVTQFFLDLAVH